jgi:uncharacterized membrane protein YhaH (DUF805 family)
MSISGRPGPGKKIMRVLVAVMPGTIIEPGGDGGEGSGHCTPGISPMIWEAFVPGLTLVPDLSLIRMRWHAIRKSTMIARAAPTGRKT